MRIDVALIPGLHGSTALFQTFIALAPPWARCVPLELPAFGPQSFEGITDVLERRIRGLEQFVIFGESFGGPVAARLAARLGSKVVLTVLCNPLVEAPIVIGASLAAALLRSRAIPEWLVAFAMTGGDRTLARAVVREVRSLPAAVLADRLSAAMTARRDDLAAILAAPVLVITGAADRLLSPRRTEALVDDVAFAVKVRVDAPHLAAQIAPAQVWAAISAELETAA